MFCWRNFCASFFLKTVPFDKEINFSIHDEFFDFSIQIQRYKNRKILGRIFEVMINSSTKGQKRCSVSLINEWAVFIAHFHTFKNRILKNFLNEKCVFACLFSCIKIWANYVEYFKRNELECGHWSDLNFSKIVFCKLSQFLLFFFIFSVDLSLIACHEHEILTLGLHW